MWTVPPSVRLIVVGTDAAPNDGFEASRCVGTQAGKQAGRWAGTTKSGIDRSWKGVNQAGWLAGLFAWVACSFATARLAWPLRQCIQPSLLEPPLDHRQRSACSRNRAPLLALENQPVERRQSSKGCNPRAHSEGWQSQPTKASRPPSSTLSRTLNYSLTSNGSTKTHLLCNGIGTVSQVRHAHLLPGSDVRSATEDILEHRAPGPRPARVKARVRLAGMVHQRRGGEYADHGWR